MDHFTSLLTAILFGICLLSAHSDHSVHRRTTPSLSSGVSDSTQRLLYVAVPGIRSYLGYGGHGLVVFDMDNDYKFVKRIKTSGIDPDDGEPDNVKGIDISIPLNSLFISTRHTLQRIDIATEEIIWEKSYEGGCDRMSISPDGLTMYLPSLEKDFWNVVDCETGNVIAKFEVFTRAHNTIYGPSGQHVYLGDIGTPFLNIADPEKHQLSGKVGPFSGGIRPFTINSTETRAYLTVNGVLGFEVGDLKTGKRIAKIEVKGWDKGPVRRHSCPSHGIALTVDEKEVWVCDAFNMRLHIFSAVEPFQQMTSIPLQDMPGWVTMSLDGKHAFPSSGEVIDVKTRNIITLLKDEHFNTVCSEKMIEAHVLDGQVVTAGDQFGIGRAGN